MADTTPGGAETLIFLHVPKTGGRTLRSVIRRQYGAERVFDAYDSSPAAGIERYERLSPEERRRYRAILGHVPIVMHRKVPGPYRYVTMLRDPVRRVISEYFYIRRTTNHPKHELVREGGMSLEEAVRSGEFPMFENGQARILAYCWNEYGECPPDVVDRALAAVDRHRMVVGLTERYDESLLLMRAELGWAWPRMPYVRRNVGSKRPRVAELPDRTVELIRDYNRLDLELYRRVAVRLDDDIAAAGESFRRELAAFRLANRTYDRLWGLRSRAARSLPRHRARTGTRS